MAPLFNQGFLTHSWPSINRSSSAIPDTNLKVYWKFNEASGDIINQSLGAANLGAAADLDTIAGMTYGATGKIGDACSFDGVNDYAIAGTSVSQFDFLHEDKFTFAYWMKYGSVPGTTEGIFSTDEQGEGAGIFIYTGSGSEYRCTVTNATPTSIANESGAANGIPDETNWYFYVIKFDASLSTNTLELRRNDAQIHISNRITTAVSGNSHRAMLVGGRQITSPQRYGHFDLDETSIWNEWMTSGNETTLYNSGSGLEIY
jgi:hypothetical protein